MELALECEVNSYVDVELIDSAKSVIDRMRLAVDTTSALANLAPWLCDYTKLDPDTYFSFKDHEMQIDMINDTNARQATQKCSQVGLSEGSFRKALGITAVSKAKHVMYVLPTRTFASKFSSSRIKPAIESSPMLSQMVNKNAKGSELMGIGTSFLHLGGTTGAATGAISVPATYIFVDELDFCDQVVVGKYESRLKHAPEDIHGRKGMVCYFSTPTVEDYGINKKFKQSDQKHYHVHCSNCETIVEDPDDAWFEPDYFRDIVVPGYTKNLINLTPEDVNAGDLDIKNSYMKCPHCLSDVWDDLCDPKRRKWVAKFPDAIISGRQIHPWDVPKVNSIPSIIMQITEYENIADYYNFTIGIPFADKNNSFLLAPFENGKYSNWNEAKPHDAAGSYCIGVDVGRRAHIKIGRKDNTGKYHVEYMERFKASKEYLLGERIVELAKLFKARCIVIDAMPDFTTAQYVAKKMPFIIVLACEYTRAKPKGKLANYNVDTESNLVSAYRTGVLTDYLNAHNSGDYLYPNEGNSLKVKKEITELKLNLKNLKKVKKLDGEGEEVETFVKTGPDHYGHTGSYLKMACDILGENLYSHDVPPAPVNITSFKTQGKIKKEVAKPIGGLGLGVMAPRS